MTRAVEFKRAEHPADADPYDDNVIASYRAMVGPYELDIALWYGLDVGPVSTLEGGGGGGGDQQLYWYVTLSNEALSSRTSGTAIAATWFEFPHSVEWLQSLAVQDLQARLRMVADELAWEPVLSFDRNDERASDTRPDLCCDDIPYRVRP